MNNPNPKRDNPDRVGGGKIIIKSWNIFILTKNLCGLRVKALFSTLFKCLTNHQLPLDDLDPSKADRQSIPDLA